MKIPHYLVLSCLVSVALSYVGKFTDPVCQMGRDQSPINVRARYTIKRPFKRFRFTGFINSLEIIKYSNKIVGTAKDELSISSGCLVHPYNFHSMHIVAFSEHLLNKRRYPFEIQLFFIRNYRRESNTFNVTEIEKAAKIFAIVILSIMVEIDPNVRERDDMNLLVYEVSRLRHEKTTTVNMPLTELIPNITQMFMYEGSLTENPCTEGVFWILVKPPEKISPRQAGQLMKVYTQVFRRPIQKGRNRTIYEYKAPSAISTYSNGSLTIIVILIVVLLKMTV